MDRLGWFYLAFSTYSPPSLVSAAHACVTYQQAPINTSKFPILPSHVRKLKGPFQGHKSLGRKPQAIPPHPLNKIPWQLLCCIPFPSASSNLASQCQVSPAPSCEMTHLAPAFSFSLSPSRFSEGFLHNELILKQCFWVPQGQSKQNDGWAPPVVLPLQSRGGILAEQPAPSTAPNKPRGSDGYPTQAFSEKFSQVLLARCLSG